MHRRFAGRQTPRRSVPRPTLATLLLVASGCTTGGTLFPNDHRLLPAARDVAAATRPSDPRELSKLALEAFYVQPGDVLLL